MMPAARGQIPHQPRAIGQMGPMPGYGTIKGPVASPMGLPTPQMGGKPSVPQMGGSIPQMGSMPPMGVPMPPMGGSMPPMGMGIPQMGMNMPPMGMGLPPMMNMPPQMGMQPPKMGNPPMPQDKKQWMIMNN